MFSFLLIALSGLTYAQQNQFGVPASTETGQCKSGQKWELIRFENGWYWISGPGGEFIGLNKKLLVKSACRQPKAQLAVPQNHFIDGRIALLQESQLRLS